MIWLVLLLVLVCFLVSGVIVGFVIDFCSILIGNLKLICNLLLLWFCKLIVFFSKCVIVEYVVKLIFMFWCWCEKVLFSWVNGLIIFFNCWFGILGLEL